MKKVIFWIGGIIVLLILISYLLPGSYNVERSTVIHSKPHVIHMLTSDFRLWHVWAPWTKERDTTAVFTTSGEPRKPGSTWSWTAEQYGQGEMTLRENIPGKLLAYDLAFDMGKYKSNGSIAINQTGDSCTVTWVDQGELGFNPMARYMGLFMDGMMGPDFEQGLEKLKKVSEERKDWSSIEELTWPPHQFLAIRDSAGPATYSAVMGKAFGEIMHFIAKEGLNLKGAPFSIYLRWDSVTMFSVMDIGMAVEKASKGAGRIRVVDYPEQKVVSTRYFGPYENTAPSYYMLEQYIRETGQEFAGGPWEIYITDPTMEPDTSKWETAIVFPVK